MTGYPPPGGYPPPEGYAGSAQPTPRLPPLPPGARPLPVTWHQAPGASAYRATAAFEVTEPLEYHRLHRAGRPGWWWPLLGCLGLVIAATIVGPAIALVPLLVLLAMSGELTTAGFEAALDLDDPTPTGLGFLLLALAMLIPLSWVLMRTLHDLRPRWLTSVGPRIRWKYFTACFGLAFVALLASLVVSLLLPSGDVGGTAPELNDFTTQTRDFLVVMLLITPLQAAGEEYAFRGYLTQACGGLFAHPAVAKVVAIVVPSVLFALAHGSQSAPVFIDRLAFGLVAGYLVIATGGLEAGIAMHVLNNFVAFGVALAYGDLGAALNATGGSWWLVPTTLTQSLVYLFLATAVARKMGVATTADPSVLASSRRLVYRSPPPQPGIPD
jgi:uncharacterized protein